MSVIVHSLGFIYNKVSKTDTLFVLPIWWIPLKELVSAIGAATNLCTEAEHKTKLKLQLTRDPVFETLCIKKKIQILDNVQNTGQSFAVYHRGKYLQ